MNSVIEINIKECVRFTEKGKAYCEKSKCKCGKIKAWNLSDSECGVHRPHGNGIVSAKNRAKGKYHE